LNDSKSVIGLIVAGQHLVVPEISQSDAGDKNAWWLRAIVLSVTDSQSTYSLWQRSDRLALTRDWSKTVGNMKTKVTEMNATRSWTFLLKATSINGPIA